MHQLTDLVEANTLALAVIDAIIDPFVVLDNEVRVVAASRSFYETFNVEPEKAHGQSLYALCEAAWDVPTLHDLLRETIAKHGQFDGLVSPFEFPVLGKRTLCLNARVVAPQGDDGPTTLVLMNDITARLQIESEKQALLSGTQELLRQQRMLMGEMQHRVANSLQIIASILMLKANAVTSEETREHLRDAQQRVISVAEVQAHLHSVEGIARIEIGAYLHKLCGGLAKSMTGPDHPIAIDVRCSVGTIGSASAVSLGLIVTELVINAVKYAFPAVQLGARILVEYETSDQAWRLTVSDNGQGKCKVPANPSGGLGTAIVTALAKQLGGNVASRSTTDGFAVTIEGVQAGATLPLAA